MGSFINYVTKLGVLQVKYKNKGKNDISSYRPISNLCSSSKIFEKIKLRRILEIQEEKSIDCYHYLALTQLRYRFEICLTDKPQVGTSICQNLVQNVSKMLFLVLQRGGEGFILFTKWGYIIYEPFNQTCHRIKIETQREFGNETSARPWTTIEARGRAFKMDSIWSS